MMYKRWLQVIYVDSTLFSVVSSVNTNAATLLCKVKNSICLLYKYADTVFLCRAVYMWAAISYDNWNDMLAMKCDSNYRRNQLWKIKMLASLEL